MATVKNVASATSMTYDVKTPTPARSGFPCQPKLPQYSVSHCRLIVLTALSKSLLVVLRLST